MSEPSNSDRADWAYVAVEAFAAEVREEDMLGEETDLVISDLLCDLMHLCDVAEINWTACIERAEGHYREEIDEESLDEGSSEED